MEMNITVWLPTQGEKSLDPSAIVYDEQSLRALLLGILANNKDFYGIYDFMCSAQSNGEYTTKESMIQSILGTAILRKSGGKLSTVMATGPFVGLLEQIIPEHI